MYVSHLDIKTRSTATTTRRQRIIHNLELAANQLPRKINLAALQQLQARPIHDDLCPGAVIRRKHRIILIQLPHPFLPLLRRWGIERWQRREGHQVLEAVATTALDLDPEGEVRVRVFRHDLLQPLCLSVSECF
jgi:hypothetical protein